MIIWYRYCEHSLYNPHHCLSSTSKETVCSTYYSSPFRAVTVTEGSSLTEEDDVSGSGHNVFGECLWPGLCNFIKRAQSILFQIFSFFIFSVCIICISESPAILSWSNMDIFISKMHYCCHAAAMSVFMCDIQNFKPILHFLDIFTFIHTNHRLILLPVISVQFEKSNFILFSITSLKSHTKTL